MKKFKITKHIMKIVNVVLCLFCLYSGGVFADIRYTHHDFEYWSWAYPTQANPRREICVFCHTPHNADTDTADGLLWNHTITSAAFNTYTSATLDASVPSPNGISKLCLSCHDGTIAVDSHSGMPGTKVLGSGFGTEGGVIGTDLRDDHPISFSYNTALAQNDGGLKDPSSSPSGIPGGTTIENDMLFDGKLECSSCHDVHVPRNDNSQGNCWGCHVIDGQWSTPPKKLTLSLRVGNEKSALCLTCHIK